MKSMMIHLKKIQKYFFDFALILSLLGFFSARGVEKPRIKSTVDLQKSDRVPQSINPSTPLSGKTYRCLLYQKLPLLKAGCKGGTCKEILYERAIKSVDVYFEPSLKSKVVDRLEKCELISDFEPYTVIHHLGKAVVTRPESVFEKIGIKTGDVISIIENDGENFIKSCIESKEFDVYLGRSNDPDLTTVELFENISSETWIRLKTPRGMVGYVNARSKFYLDSYKIDPKRFCREVKKR